MDYAGSEITQKIREYYNEPFDAAEDARFLAFDFLKNFNDKHIKLIDCPPHKRIFLFFLTRIIKTYSAIFCLCRQGYGQDTSPLLRSSLETLISAKYILYDLKSADKNAVRFVEYKWVIFRRHLSESERDPAAKESDDFVENRD
ncbi:MAG: DUF5677 domain-containing protein, partial [Candidatus Omnitrophica bacterium]|nr:DUF5677 domain-containing protein [Candidatus Omnitrophota bacterium]